MSDIYTTVDLLNYPSKADPFTQFQYLRANRLGTVDVAWTPETHWYEMLGVLEGTRDTFVVLNMEEQERVKRSLRNYKVVTIHSEAGALSMQKITESIGYYKKMVKSGKYYAIESYYSSFCSRCLTIRESKDYDRRFTILDFDNYDVHSFQQWMALVVLKGYLAHQEYEWTKFRKCHNCGRYFYITPNTRYKTYCGKKCKDASLELKQTA